MLLRKIFIIFALVITSCASNKEDRSFVSHKSEDIEEKLGIEQDRLKKFEVKTYDKKKPEKKPTVKKIVKKKTVQTKEPVKKAEKEKSQESVKKATEKSASIERKNLEITENEIKVPGLPEDYPQEFIKYDEVSRNAWNQVKPYIFIGEEFTFRVSYLGITAGHIKMTTKPIVEVQGKRAYRFKAMMRSSRYYEFIYTLDDSLESVVLADNFLPVKYVLIQRESKQDVDDLQLFDHDARKTYVWYKRIKNEQEKKREFEKYIPGLFQDSYSSLYFVRGLPLKIGDVYEFPVVTRGKVWLLKLLVEKKEKIDVNGDDVEAYRIKAETRFPGVLEKKGDIIFWYSTDSLRRLLKFNAKIKIGSVEGELVEFSPGEPIE